MIIIDLFYIILQNLILPLLTLGKSPIFTLFTFIDIMHLVLEECIQKFHAGIINL